MNGDRIPDLAVSNALDNTVALLPGTGTGSFGAKTTVSTGAQPSHVALADLNGDGVADLMTPNAGGNNVSVRLGLGGKITPAGVTLVNQGASQMYTITPQAGYGVSDVRVDGVSQGSVTTFTFSNVTAPHTIVVAFRPVP